MPTVTRPPRSAAARRAAGEGDHPAETAEQRQPEERNDQPDLAAQLAQAQAAREQAEEDARLAREEAEMLRQEREAIAPPAAPAAGPGDDVPTSSVPVHEGPRSVVPRAEANADVTAEELELVRRLRDSRTTEIYERIAQSPTQVGTDLDQYTLVHLRGCPKPDRTETYESQNSITRQLFTVHRCVECGAHIAIPH